VLGVPSALAALCKRVRVVFGKTLAEQTVTMERVAESRIAIDQARLLITAPVDDGPSATRWRARRSP
jgi:alkylation response protein AidB-like acyl-CoA dehydrogenase